MRDVEKIKKQILKENPKAKGINLSTNPPLPMYFTIDILKKKKEECTDFELEIQKIYTNVIIF